MTLTEWLQSHLRRAWQEIQADIFGDGEYLNDGEEDGYYEQSPNRRN